MGLYRCGGGKGLDLGTPIELSGALGTYTFSEAGVYAVLLTSGSGGWGFSTLAVTAEILANTSFNDGSQYSCQLMILKCKAGDTMTDEWPRQNKYGRIIRLGDA